MMAYALSPSFQCLFLLTILLLMSLLYEVTKTIAVELRGALVLYKSKSIFRAFKPSLSVTINANLMAAL